MSVFLCVVAMPFAFETYTLDPRVHELRCSGARIPVEPQVFDLLQKLIECRDRLVTKDELIEAIWNGRAVTDAAIASRIRLARQAIGDDGTEQRFIRTVHGIGFRFVAPVTETVSVTSAQEVDQDLESPEPSTRPSIAVLPFEALLAVHKTIIADAIPHDLIQALSRLRWLFVTSRLSSFRFRGPNLDVQDTGRQLGVRYCLTGTVERHLGNMVLSVELTDTLSGEMVWGETFQFPVDDIHDIRANIVGQVVSALEVQIPSHEANRARLNATNNLDAWSSYHLGLQHVYRFNQRDTQSAKIHFEGALAQDPDFARAHAGLSFAHFQDAFVKYRSNAAEAAELARRHAERAVELDPVDPFANLTMGRYFWLRGELDRSADWLERVKHLSPNHAQAIYSKAWVDALAGRSEDALSAINLAVQLSPFDPLLYAMFGVRALSHIGRGDPGLAAYWGEKAAVSPGAHYLIGMIAVVGHAMNGDDVRAREWSERVRRKAPYAKGRNFLEAFPFESDDIRQMIEKLLRTHGFSN